MKTLTQLITSIALKRAAAKYARTLPSRLIKDYGAAEFYTCKQIEASARRAGLPRAHLALAHAMYLPRDAFVQIHGNGETYDKLRALFTAKLPNVPSEEFSPLGPDPYIMSGGG